MFLHDLEVILASPSVFFIVLLALAFDFSNGFHDAANSIATIVGTRTLKPYQAVLWAAFWNFIAAWFFGIAIANTIAKWVFPEWITPEVIAAGLVGALSWNIITWAKGLPTSSSHALLGGFSGAAIAHAGTAFGVVHGDKLLTVCLWLFGAPIVGALLAAGISRLTRLAVGAPKGSTKLSRGVQLVSSAAYSLGHGTNDAQKTMGIIAALLYCTVWKDRQAAFTAGTAAFPFWIVLVCHIAIGLGTLAGGWRIVNTLAFKVTNDLTTRGGACAETAAAVTLFTTAKLGVPISTTHAITGSLAGVGIEDKGSTGVFWPMLKRIAKAWLLTIPGAALIAALAYPLICLLM